MGQGIHRIQIVDALNREWLCLRADPSYDAVVAGWARVEPALAGLSSLGQVEASAGAKGVNHDPLLAAFVRRAQQGPDPQLAQRVVVQLFVGAAVNMAWRLVPRFGDAESAAGAVLAALCETVAAYPLAARPELVAANLRLDTLKRALASSEAIPQESASSRATRGVSRVRRAPAGAASWAQAVSELEDVALEQSVAFETVRRAVRLELVGADDAAVERWRQAPDLIPDQRDRMLAVLVEAVRLELLDREAARMLAASFSADGPSDDELASAHGCSLAALRKRRSRALARLCEHRGQLAAAA